MDGQHRNIMSSAPSNGGGDIKIIGVSERKRSFSGTKRATIINRLANIKTTKDKNLLICELRHDDNDDNKTSALSADMICGRPSSAACGALWRTSLF